MAEMDFPHASIVEGVRFTAQVAVPNVLQGLFRRRRTAVALATRTGADSLAHGFIAGLKRSYGNGPLWIRVAKDEALLLFGEDAIRKVLERSPDPFAADPEPKKSGMSHFQPDALTISRNPEWEDRRSFTEAVLDTGAPHHRFAERFEEVCVEEASSLPTTFGWEEFNACIRRITRRVILGEKAADDDELSELLGQLMDKSNPPGGGSAELFDRFSDKLSAYVKSAPASGCITAAFADAPVTELTKPAGQVTHWLFALGDTLAINALRALALLAAFDEIRERAVDDPALLRASLQEAMRLWPTTPMLSRELTSAIEWGSVSVPKGTQVLIVNSFNHRDKEAIPYASEFAPQEWLPGGDASGRWIFNHFSHGPQGCPGSELALSVGSAVLVTLLRRGVPRAVEQAIDPGKPMPYALDYFALKFELYGNV
jgi:cytochrome P450